ncbi:hypothetical protein ACMFMG_009859 [Clarireedia jacksonii]
MSSPISDFCKLYISETMHATRSGHMYSHQSLKGKAPAGDTNDGDDSDHGVAPEIFSEPEDESDTDGEENTQTRFAGEDFQGYESEEEYLPDDGSVPSQTILAVDHCRHVQSPNDTYYAFQLGIAEVRGLGIRFRSSQTREEECSCGDPACNHIAWLKSQIHITNGQSVYDYLQDRSMPRDESYEYEPASWRLANKRQRGHTITRSRRKAVRDIMSTFHHDTVAEEYRPDIFDFALYSHEVLAPYDLEATLSKLLIHDDDTFQKFESIVSQERCDTEYFRKMGQKVFGALDKLDEFESTGKLSDWTAMGPYSNTKFQHDVPWCARTLVELVDLIRDNLQWRKGMSYESQTLAAALLIQILEAIVFRNTELYTNIDWVRQRPHGEPSTHRNLYLNLLGSQSENGRGEFILDALESLPEEATAPRHYIDRLTHLQFRLSSHAYAASSSYMNRLGYVVARLRRNHGLPEIPTAASASSGVLSSSLGGGSTSSSRDRRGSSSLVGRGSLSLAGRDALSSTGQGSSSRAGRDTPGPATRSLLGKRTARSSSATERKGKRTMM